MNFMFHIQNLCKTDLGFLRLYLKRSHMLNVITPHVSDVMGVIVLTSFVCVSVCLSVSLYQPNGQTYRLDFWHVGQVKNI